MGRQRLCPGATWPASGISPPPHTHTSKSAFPRGEKPLRGAPPPHPPSTLGRLKCDPKRQEGVGEQRRMQLYCNSGGRQRGCPRNCCGAVREVCESWGGPEWAGRGLILLHQVSRRGRGRGRVLCPAQSSRVCNPAAAARKGCWGHLHIHRVPSSHCCALQPVCFLWWSLGLVCVWDFGLGFWFFFLEWELHRILIFILRKSFF